MLESDYEYTWEDDGETMLEAFPTSVETEEFDEFVAFKHILCCKDDCVMV